MKDLCQEVLDTGVARDEVSPGFQATLTPGSENYPHLGVEHEKMNTNAGNFFAIMNHPEENKPVGQQTCRDNPVNPPWESELPGKQASRDGPVIFPGRSELVGKQKCRDGPVD